MSQVLIRDQYIVTMAEYADTLVEARWGFGGYVYYYIDGKQVGLAWQSAITDADNFMDFVRENLPHAVFGDPDLEDAETQDDTE